MAPTKQRFPTESLLFKITTWSAGSTPLNEDTDTSLMETMKLAAEGVPFPNALPVLDEMAAVAQVLLSERCRAWNWADIEQKAVDYPVAITVVWKASLRQRFEIQIKVPPYVDAPAEGSSGSEWTPAAFSNNRLGRWQHANQPQCVPALMPPGHLIEVGVIQQNENSWKPSRQSHAGIPRLPDVFASMVKIHDKVLFLKSDSMDFKAQGSNSEGKSHDRWNEGPVPAGEQPQPLVPGPDPDSACEQVLRKIIVQLTGVIWGSSRHDFQEQSPPTSWVIPDFDNAHHLTPFDTNWTGNTDEPHGEFKLNGSLLEPGDLSQIYPFSSTGQSGRLTQQPMVTWLPPRQTCIAMDEKQTIPARVARKARGPFVATRYSFHNFRDDIKHLHCFGKHPDVPKYKPTENSALTSEHI
ncbi:hypothetical protein FQN53_007105 [Emmonsiellopsis sp. PD_33]|nr:hypothetical protein FQN53_007105 [Emmonsiellopsis sp. PD_33]